MEELAASAPTAPHCDALSTPTPPHCDALSTPTRATKSTATAVIPEVPFKALEVAGEEGMPRKFQEGPLHPAQVRLS